jgi:hypothetical protein
MPDPVYAEYLRDLEELMAAGRILGLYRTVDKLHAALNEARSEQYEANPPSPRSGTVDWAIGPVREQTKTTP